MGPQLPELQQYSSVLKTVQGLLQPPWVLSWAGHCPLISAVHLMPRVHPLDVGLKSIGTLNPSTKEISMKSKLLNWFKANSANVLGGVPYAWQFNKPPQSPVWHPPWPVPSKLHPVRAQIRAAVVPAATLMVHVWPLVSCLPPPGTAAAHTV